MKKISGYKKEIGEKYYKGYNLNLNKGNVVEKVHYINIPVSEEKNIGEDIWLEGVSCFVMNQNGEILIEKRVDKGLTPGKLDLCSGHVDGEEIPIQAMIRELREELGIQFEDAINVKQITPKAIPLVFESKGKKRNFLITFYGLKLNDPEINFEKKEIQEIRWTTMEKCFELIRSGATKFPKYNYEEIFEKVRRVNNNENPNIEIENKKDREG